jgi:uncharacterized RDD family membrane protein YckC
MELEAISPPDNVEDAVVVASKLQRFGTLIIDYIVYIVLSVILGVLIALIFGAPAIQGFRSYIWSSALLLFYYIGFEGILARTPGKYVMGTKVVTQTGGTPSWEQIVSRTLARFIPFEAFSLLFSDSSLGWHDTMPKTKVVRTR